MPIGSIFRSFLPREERFHELLREATQNLVRASEIFSEIAATPDLEQRRVKLVQLKALEHQGDEVTRRIFEALNSTFITPFDREDIRSLAVDVDDVLDYLEGIGQFVVLFEIRESPEALSRFAGILRDLCGQIDGLTELIWDLSQTGPIRDRMVRVSDLENEADHLYLTALGALFRKDNGKDAIEVMKWKEIFQDLEDACDKCKDFTHVLGNMVIKNA